MGIIDGRNVWLLDEREVLGRTDGQDPREALALACLAAGVANV